MKKISTFLWLFVILLNIQPLSAQQSLGTIQDNTNPALPNSYNFKEYVFAEPNDQGNCLGNVNASATIEEVFFAQTHRHAVDHPFFFTIGHRPMLLQMAVTGSGQAPDVQVEGFMNGQSLGTLCLKGPANLANSINLDIPNFEDYFSVTIPKAWVKIGLSLEVRAGSQTRSFSAEELKIGPYTEMNLVMYNMDFLDYNTAPHRTPIIDNFLQEMASAIPASVVRFGTFPATLRFPEVLANNDTEQLVRLRSIRDKEPNGIFSDGSINSIATLFLGNLHRSTGDYLSTIYFGNTLNLAPGGWGGGKSFVSFDYDDVFIHELGHALSLPHWGDWYNFDNPNEYEFLYPYGGKDDNGGGRGESWNFIQDIYEFIDPICQFDERGTAGLETSDAMQRNNHCLEDRSESQGPWDGFGDFSALAMHRYLVGADVRTGTVNYKSEDKAFQFNMQGGFPAVSLQNGKRVYTRDASQPTEVPFDHTFEIPGEEQLNVPVYLIYGNAHESQTQANIVYKPIKFNGTLPPVIDPTNPSTFAELQDPRYIPHLASPRDLTLKITYADGSVLHAINPYHSFARAPYTWGFHIWRDDICNWSLVVPGDKELVKVELYKRPFVLGNEGTTTPGNINDPRQNITAENFMDDAVWLAEYDINAAKVLGSNTIGNRVWQDLNRNGLDDFDEPGIPGVTLLLWEDSDDNGIPDSEGFLGATETDENGHYSFGALSPGKYVVFVWFVNNWEEGQPLHNMVPTSSYTDPNSDINGDNNGRDGSLEFPGLSNLDIASGIVELSLDGEPLNDGDREDDWFDYDPSGNMTVDFGFHFTDGCPVINAYILGTDTLCGDDRGNLAIAPASGNAPYSYEWNTGATDSLLTDLEPGTYTATITDGNGCTGTASVELVAGDANTCNPTSISEEEELGINISPNPFDHHLNIEVNLQEPLSFELWSIAGKKLQEAKLATPLTRLDLSSLASGIYLGVIKRQNGSVLTYKKLVRVN